MQRTSGVMSGTKMEKKRPMQKIREANAFLRPMSVKKCLSLDFPLTLTISIKVLSTLLGATRHW